MSNDYLNSPVVQAKALALAESYHRWQQARTAGTTQADTIQAESLARETAAIATSLFNQAKAIRGPVNRISMRSRDAGDDGIISPDNQSASAAEYISAEDELKKTLNRYVAELGVKHHFSVPENNDYYGSGRIRG